MPKLSIATYCMSRLDFVKQAIDSYLAVPDAEVIVCDYSCPQGTGDWLKANRPTVKVVRIEGQRWFNQPAARNAAVAACESEWVCAIDCDMILSGRFAGVLYPNLRPNCHYRFVPLKEGYVGTSVFQKQHWRFLGGYDEALANYGDDDYDFYDGLEFAGIRKLGLALGLARHIDHDQAARTANYENKRLRESIMVARIYRMVKWEWSRFTKAIPSLDARRWLYQKMAIRVPVELRKLDMIFQNTTNAKRARDFVCASLVELACAELRELGLPSIDGDQLKRMRESLDQQ